MVAIVGACAAPIAAMVGVGPSRIPPTIVGVMATCGSDPAGPKSAWMADGIGVTHIHDDICHICYICLE